VKLVVVANPGSRRLSLLGEAIARAGLPPVEAIAWSSFLRDPEVLSQRLEGRCALRIESPGQDFEVERELIAMGDGESAPEGFMVAPNAAAIGVADARRLSEDRGRILYPRQWFLGFCRALRTIKSALDHNRDVVCLNHPDDIQRAFDKNVCQSRLEAAGVSVVPRLRCPASFDELVSIVRDRGLERVFVKLAHGSSASGVVALSLRPGHEFAYTSAQIERGATSTRLYNSRRMSKYRALRDVRFVIDTLCREGVIVEVWLPKITQRGAPCDLRVVTVRGKSRHVVVRVGRGPITNLHLGNRRGDLDELRTRAGEPAWASAMSTCEAAACVFSRSFYLGIDLLIEPGFIRSRVLEVNAFGDLLPGVLDLNQDTYDAEIQEFLKMQKAADA
jgi:hypothetical protein